MDKLLPLLKHEEEKPLILAKVINYSFYHTYYSNYQT